MPYARQGIVLTAMLLALASGAHAQASGPGQPTGPAGPVPIDSSAVTPAPCGSTDPTVGVIKAGVFVTEQGAGQTTHSPDSRKPGG
ncbi:MAG TPA: hypothetical protein VJY39_07685 [Acidisphaera sp.]|nr:hypothetical protein [Acidisphaera sp.]